MPFSEYQCSSLCKNVFELFHKVNEEFEGGRQKSRAVIDPMISAITVVHSLTPVEKKVTWYRREGVERCLKDLQRD